MNVGDLMQTEVVSLCADDPLDIVEDVMRLGRLRHLPVLDGDRLVGVVTQRDLFRAGMSSVLQLDGKSNRRWLRKIDVRAIMTTDVETIRPDQPVRAAVQAMADKKIGCLPVVEQDHLVGLISETDCLAYLAHILEGAEVRQELPELRGD